MGISMFNSSKRRHRRHHHKTSHNPNTDLHYRIITAESPSSVPAENYRRAKVSLSFSEIDKKIQVLQINSATQGEGKTTTLLNLAMTYVEDGLKVILIDLDLRRPKLHRSLKIKNECGVTDVLSGKATLEEAIKHSKWGYDLLNSGTKTSYPTAQLGSQAIEAMFVELRKNYDMILVDNAPVLSVSDPILISRLCDAGVFVVSQAKSRKGVSREAINILRQNKVPIVGVIFTEISKSNGNYYSYYKYYYESYYSKTSPIKAVGAQNNSSVTISEKKDEKPFYPEVEENNK